MDEGTKAEDKEPSFPAFLVEVKPGKGDEDEKEDRVAKYPAVAEGVSEEELPYGFINDVGEKRAYEQKPYVYAISQGSEGRCSNAWGAILTRQGFGGLTTSFSNLILCGGEGITFGEDTI